MADAGKIMIMPKGAYDASASYEVLDLVTHKGNVWVAKRNVTGVEPSEANSADWFLMADLANYLPLTGGDLSGNVLISSDSGDAYVRVHNKNKDSGVSLMAGASGNSGLYSDKKKAFVVKISNDGSVDYATGTMNGSAVIHEHNYSNYALPLSGGGTVTKVGRDVINVNRDNASADSVTIGYRLNGTSLGEIGASNGQGAIYRQADGTVNTLLHTGNKPTGSYTGNGSATSRDITTGGIGKACLVYSEKGAVFIDAKGGLGHTSGGTYKVFKYTETKKETNYLRVATTDELLNASGVEYTYQVM